MGDQPFLYGDPGLPTALSAAQIRETKLDNQLVFLEGCYGTQIADAFLDAGAKAVVGNSGITWGRRFFLGPAQVVGKAWLKAFEKGESPNAALTTALQELNKKWNDRFSLGWKVKQGVNKA